MFSHVTVGSNDIPRSKAFYDTLTKPLGLVRHMEFPDGIGYGRKDGRAQLWIVRPLDKNAATVGNGLTIGLDADTRAACRRRAARDARQRRQGRRQARPSPGLPCELLRRVCSRSGRQQGVHRLPQAGVRRSIDDSSKELRMEPFKVFWQPG